MADPPEVTGKSPRGLKTKRLADPPEVTGEYAVLNGDALNALGFGPEQLEMRGAGIENVLYDGDAQNVLAEYNDLYSMTPTREFGMCNTLYEPGAGAISEGGLYSEHADGYLYTGNIDVRIV